MRIIQVLALLVVVGVAKSQNVQFAQFFNCDETRDEVVECSTNGDFFATGYIDVNIANFEDYFTIQKNDSGFWFQAHQLSTVNDEDNTKILNLEIKYQTETETQDGNVAITIIEKNNWAPEIEGDDTFSGISKMFPTGVALELAYPNIDIVATDKDYVESTNSSMNEVACVVSDDTKDLMDCAVKYRDIGVYGISLSYKKSPMDIEDLGISHTFKIKAQDNGENNVGQLATEKSITLNFLPENLKAPTFSENFYQADIPNQKFTVAVPLVTVSATDSEGNKFEYKLGDISGLPEGDTGVYFLMDASSGVVSWIKEMPTALRGANNIIEINIQAIETDTVERKSSMGVVIVQVPGDISPPVLDPSQLSTEISLSAGVLSMNPVDLTISDADAWQDLANLEIFVLGEGSDQFSAVMTDGKVHLSLNAGTSLDGLPPGGLISLLVQVSNKDDSVPKMTGSTLVRISYPYNAQAPLFETVDIIGDVSNSSIPGNVILRSEIKANDPDGISGIVYTIFPSNPLFALQGQVLQYAGGAEFGSTVTIGIQGKEDTVDQPRFAHATVTITFDGAHMPIILSTTSTVPSTSVSTVSSATSPAVSTSASTAAPTSTVTTATSSQGTTTSCPVCPSTTTAAATTVCPTGPSTTSNPSPSVSTIGPSSTVSSGTSGTSGTSVSSGSSGTVFTTPTMTMTSTVPIGEHVLKFLSGDEGGAAQFVGYPSFVVLENSVPMPVAKVIAECDDPAYNHLIRYTLQDTQKFFVDQISGDIFAVNPIGGLQMSNICSRADDCTVEVTAVIQDNRATLTLHVVSIEKPEVLVINSELPADQLLNQLNQNSASVWFRSLNVQMDADTTKAASNSTRAASNTTRAASNTIRATSNTIRATSNKHFVTARRTDSPGIEYLNRDEAEVVVDGLGIVISSSDEVFVNQQDNIDGDGGDSNEVPVIVLSVLLSIVLLAIITYFLVLYRRPIMNKFRKEKSGSPPVERMSPESGSEVRRPSFSFPSKNPMAASSVLVQESSEPTKKVYGTPAVGGSSQNGLTREISHELEMKLEKKTAAETGRRGLPPPKEKPLPVGGKAGPTTKKKAAPKVPPATYVDEDVGVKFTERVEVVEVPKQRKQSSNSSGSSESSGSSTSGSSSDSGSEEEATTSI